MLCTAHTFIIGLKGCIRRVLSDGVLVYMGKTEIVTSKARERFKQPRRLSSQNDIGKAWPIDPTTLPHRNYTTSNQSKSSECSATRTIIFIHQFRIYIHGTLTNPGAEQCSTTSMLRKRIWRTKFIWSEDPDLYISVDITSYPIKARGSSILSSPGKQFR